MYSTKAAYIVLSISIIKLLSMYKGGDEMTAEQYQIAIRTTHNIGLMWAVGILVLTGIMIFLYKRYWS